jgi:DNA repair protein RadC
MVKNKFEKYIDKIRENIELKVGELEVSYTIPPSKVTDLPVIKTCKDAYDYIINKWQDDILAIERFKVLYLNRSNRVIGILDISKGNAVNTISSPKDVFGPALNIPTCCGIIICHNHPSCNLQPSDADIELTKTMKETGKTMFIPLLDHVIVTPDYFFSFADEGIL